MGLSRELGVQDLLELPVPARPAPGELLPRPGVHHVVDRQVGLPLDLLAVPQPQRLSALPEPPALGLALLRRVQVVPARGPLTVHPVQVVLKIKPGPRMDDGHPGHLLSKITRRTKIYE